MTPNRSGPRNPLAPRAAVLAAVALVGVGIIGSSCSSDDETPDEEPQLERIDQPAEVDEERLGGEPGAVNDPEQGG